MAAKGKWAAFPYPAKGFRRAGAALERDWAVLHAGDCEPFPDKAATGKRLKQAGAGALDPEATAAALQEAWRDFHAGDFQAAFDAGVALGPVGASVAVKAAGIHATHLVEDAAARLARYQALVKLAEAAVEALPGEANSHYRHAYALGRYSQGISVAKALQQGLAGKVRDSLERALKLAPKHAEAHSAMGLYHCEIIGKVGAMIGGLTYGAKAALGEKYLAKALELAPESPIAHIEYGNGLLLLHGEKREDEAASAYERAARLKPRDAMEKLDAEYAAAQLED